MSPAPDRDFLPDRPMGDGDLRAGLASWYAPGLSDGLGDRLLMFDNTDASSLELLRFKREFGHLPDFEGALRRRVQLLDQFQHPNIARVRSVEWLRAGEELALVSNHTPGRRLSEIIPEAKGPAFARQFIRQVTPAIAALHRESDDVSHGAITPERIIVSPEGKLIVTEHVLAPAIRALQFSSSRLQSELGLAEPLDGTVQRLDQRADIVQIGLIAFSLLIGRRVDPADYRAKGAVLLDEFVWIGSDGAPVAPALRAWLEQALQFSATPFASAIDAIASLPELADHQGKTEEPAPAELRPLPRPTPIRLVNEPPPGFLSEAEVMLGDAPPRVATPAPKIVSSIRPTVAAPITVSTPSGSTVVPPPAANAAAAPKSVPPPAAPMAAASSATATPKPRARTALYLVAALFGIVAIAEGAVLAGLITWRPFGSKPPATGSTPTTTTSRTTPPANELRIDAAAPPLPPGATATPGVNSAGGASVTGQLEVTSDPPGAKVTIDGNAHGVTPITVPLPPGQHAVVVTDGTTTSKRTMTVAAGGTASFLASFAPAGIAAGWITFKTPIDLQIREKGTLLGSTSADRLMLTAGRHTLDLANSELGFTTTATIEVTSGKTVTSTVPIPNGSLTLNALPWANVTLDGQALTGTTPYANIEVPIGPHEVIWKHPQFGERKETIIVTAKAPVRIVRDLRK